MKTGIIVSHPNLEHSGSQQFFKAALSGEKVGYRHLETIRKVGVFNREEELAWLASYDRIILQFPLYWYSCPATMKEWIDITMGNSLLRGKELGVVVTAAVKKLSYQAGGREGYTISELMRPFEAMSRANGMRYLPVFAVHQFEYLTEDEKAELLVEYLRYVTQKDIELFTLNGRERWLLDQMDSISLSVEQKNKIKNWLLEAKEEREELVSLLSDMKGKRW